MDDETEKARTERVLAQQYRDQQKAELEAFHDRHHISDLSAVSSPQKGRGQGRVTFDPKGPLTRAQSLVLRAYASKGDPDPMELTLLRQALARRDTPGRTEYRWGNRQSHQGNAVAKETWARHERYADNVRRFMNEDCTFHPFISAYAKAIPRPRSLSPCNRLESEAVLARRKRDVMDALRGRQEMTECTFSPVLCPKSTAIAQSLPGYGEPLFDRLHTEAEERAARREEYATYRPPSHQTPALALTQPEVDELLTRLHAWKEGKEQQLHRLASEVPEGARRSKSADGPLYSFLHKEKMGKPKKAKGRWEPQEKEERRIPTLGPGRAELAEQRFEHRLKELHQDPSPVLHLFGNDLSAVPREYADFRAALYARRKVYGPEVWMYPDSTTTGREKAQFRFRPSINQRSEELAAAMLDPTGESKGVPHKFRTSRGIEKEAKRRMDLVTRLAEEEMKGVTFQPRTTRYSPPPHRRRNRNVPPPEQPQTVMSDPSPSASHASPLLDHGERPSPNAGGQSSSFLLTLSRNKPDELVDYGRQLMQHQLLQLNKKKLLSKVVQPFT